jgi:hypothetical protein
VKKLLDFRIAVPTVGASIFVSVFGCSGIRKEWKSVPDTFSHNGCVTFFQFSLVEHAIRQIIIGSSTK